MIFVNDILTKLFANYDLLTRLKALKHQLEISFGLDAVRMYASDDDLTNITFALDGDEAPNLNVAKLQQLIQQLHIPATVLELDERDNAWTLSLEIPNDVRILE